MSSLEASIQSQIQYHTNEIQRLQEQLKALGSENFTPVVSNQLPPIEYIKARFRVSSEELYKVYNLNTRSERTILSNTLCKHNTGIIKKISHGKLYFIYQPESTNKEG